MRSGAQTTLRIWSLGKETYKENKKEGMIMGNRVYDPVTEEARPGGLGLKPASNCTKTKSIT